MTRLPRFTCYLLLSDDAGTVYVGSTTNLRRRFREHHSESNTGYTASKTWRLLHVEQYLTRECALTRERQLKRGRWTKRMLLRTLAKPGRRLLVLCDRDGVCHSLVS